MKERFTLTVPPAAAEAEARLRVLPAKPLEATITPSRMTPGCMPETRRPRALDGD